MSLFVEAQCDHIKWLLLYQKSMDNPSILQILKKVFCFAILKLEFFHVEVVEVDGVDFAVVGGKIDLCRWIRAARLKNSNKIDLITNFFEFFWCMVFQMPLQKRLLRGHSSNTWHSEGGWVKKCHLYFFCF